MEIHLKINTEVFAEALALVSRAASSVGVIDILKFARLTAKNGQFTLACNNLTMYAEASGECGDGEIQCCIRADRLRAAMVTAGETIDLSLKDSTLTWMSGRARYQMSTLPAKDFPVPKRDDKPLVTLEADLAESLKRVVFSCAVKDIRTHLFGVLIECGKDRGVTLVATDGAKLAALATEIKADADAAVILHREAINALPDGAVRARLHWRSVELDYPNGLVIASTIDGKFPDWSRVMPSGKPAGTVTVDRKALLASIKAALPFDEDAAIRLLAIEDGIQVQGETKAGERAEVGIAAKSEGSVDAWFYSAALSPAIQAARGDEITLDFGGPGTAVFFKDGPLRCVCMPARR